MSKGMNLKAGEFLIGLWHNVVPPQGLSLKISGELCNLEEFKTQLKKIKEKFTVLSLPRLTALILGEETLPSNVMVLTFDDGLRNQYEVVYPIVKELELPATFFALVGPLEGRVPATFKLQLLAGGADLLKLREIYFPEALENAGQTNLLEMEKLEGATKVFRFESQPIAEIKWVCNVLLNQHDRDKVAGEMFERVFPGQESELAKKMFLTSSEIREMAEEGIDIESHGIGHHGLATLDAETLERELIYSKKVLERIINCPITCFAYTGPMPEGKLLEAVKKAGYICGVQFLAANKINQPPHDIFSLKRIHEKDLKNFL